MLWKHKVEILKVNNLSKMYGKGDSQIKAIDGVSFSVEKAVEAIERLYKDTLGGNFSYFSWEEFNYQFDSGVSAFAFSLPWGSIVGCIVGILAIIFVTMMITSAMIRNDNIVNTLKDENL